MRYRIVADTYESLELTSKRLEMTSILTTLLKQTSISNIDKIIYLTQGKLKPEHEGIEIGISDKLALKAIHLTSGKNSIELENEYNKVGDIGKVAEIASKSKPQSVLFSEPLTVERVYETLEKISNVTGSKSIETKIRYLNNIIADSEPIEAKYIMRTVVGKLRLGIADQTVLDALAEAFTEDKKNKKELESAYNITSDLGKIANIVASNGLKAVKELKLKVGNPVRPMLAERLSSANEIIEKIGECAIEYKLDGERLQIHKSKDETKIYSRRLENITIQYPDVIKIVNNQIRAKEVIVEAEAVAINSKTKEYLPFQQLMHRRRKHGIEKAIKQYPISLNFFDVLYCDNNEIMNESYSNRRKILEGIVKVDEDVKVVPSKISDDPEEIEEFMENAIKDGCEGLVAKKLSSKYRAGAREYSWIKLKRDYKNSIEDSFDLVIIGAFYGKGKRAGKYGTYLLAVYDKENDLFRSITKIGSGFTDEDLEEFPKILEKDKINNKHQKVDSNIKADVWFIPNMVIEIIASEITLSPIHTCSINNIRKGSGLALRFPKFKGKIRKDKSPKDATESKEVEKMYLRQLKKIEKASDNN